MTTPSHATVPLSETEEAFVLLVTEEHARLVALADQRRNARLQVLFSEKGIPASTLVTLLPREGERGACLSYPP